MSEDWSLRSKVTNEAIVQELTRPLPPGLRLDTSFADALLDAYAPGEASEVARHAVSALTHYRLAAVAAAATVGAEPATLALDLQAGAAIRHIAAAVAAGGRWLAEAFDLRLSARIVPDPAGKGLMGRLSFADPALHRDLQTQHDWLDAIQSLDRRLAVRPLSLRRAGTNEIPGPDGPGPAGRALAEHLGNLDRYLRRVVVAAAQQLELGPRPVRERPDEAWLND